MVFVYRVSHVHDDPEYPEAESVFHIGIYTTRARAREAVNQLRSQPGFIDLPKGFVISREPLDVTHWEEGYT